MKIIRKKFGTIEDQEVELFELENDSNVKVSITNYGGIITEIFVPDKFGKISDVVLGYHDLVSYLENSPFFGAIIGRYGNRINKSQFELEGETIKVTPNEGNNHLHGGENGFDKVVWEAQPIENENFIGLELKYTSKDGEEGYPGNLKVKVIYSLDNNNNLSIEYFAETDKTTVCNLTNHTYFNLKDAGGSSILDHQVQIYADEFVPINEKAIPLGLIESVHGTPLDFNMSTKIGKRINSDNLQLKNGIGYDHTYLVKGEKEKLKKAARIFEESSGRVVEVLTTEPGMQFYSGNYLDGAITGKHGNVYKYRNGLCLETQHYPDSPNNPSFPTTVLKLGEKYESKTVYRFSLATE